MSGERRFQIENPDKPEAGNPVELNEQIVTNINESRKTSSLKLEYQDQPVGLDSPKPIGTGGSKEVYSVQIGNDHYALAIPAAEIDPTRTIVEKWQKVLSEPQNTNRMRQLGFMVNELCRTLNVKINGSEFPALVMKRFQDLPNEIRDSKNPRSSIGETRVFPKAEINEARIKFALEEILKEIIQLIRYGVKLGKDSFNLAVIEGRAHLFFNDLGPARFESILNEDLDRYVDGYANYALEAFINGITEAEYQELKPVLDFEQIKEDLKQKIKSGLS